MRILEKLYRSPLGRLMSLCARILTSFGKPFMVYGFKDPFTGKFRKYTRMSSKVTIMNKKKLSIANNVWVWHYTILDATEGIEIAEGAQIGAWVGIFTHGSENSIRLLGENFVNIPNTERKGYTRGGVKIGAFTFIGARSTILPGCTIGKGCIIAAGSIVSKNVPDYSIYVGNKIVEKTTLDKDLRFFKSFDFSDTYYDKEALQIIKQKLYENKD